MTKGNKKFDLDLNFGVEKENIIRDILEGKTKVEVKAEREIWKESGNIAVEIKCRNEDSGVNATESDYWVHCLTSNGKFMGAFIFSVELLKKYLQKLKDTKKLRTIYGGDNRMSLIVLIPIKNLHEIMYEPETVNEPTI